MIQQRRSVFFRFCARNAALDVYIYTLTWWKTPFLYWAVRTAPSACVATRTNQLETIPYY